MGTSWGGRVKDTALMSPLESFKPWVQMDTRLLVSRVRLVGYLVVAGQRHQGCACPWNHQPSGAAVCKAAARAYGEQSASSKLQPGATFDITSQMGAETPLDLVDRVPLVGAWLQRAHEGHSCIVMRYKMQGMLNPEGAANAPLLSCSGSWSPAPA